MSKIDDILSRYGEGSHKYLIPIIQDIRGWWTDRHSTAADLIPTGKGSAAMRARNRHSTAADLIPVIQAIQEEGYLTGIAIVRTGSFFRMFTTRIYGLAIFHDRFRFIPAGRGSAFTVINPGSQVSNLKTGI